MKTLDQDHVNYQSPEESAEIRGDIQNKNIISQFDEEIAADAKVSSKDYSAIREVLQNLHTLIEHKEIEIADSLIENLLMLDPLPRHIFELASYFYESSYDERAQRFYVEALGRLEQDAPFSFEAYKNLGNILLKQGNFKESEELYNKAYALNPDSSVLMVNFGILEMQQGNLQKAKQRYRLAVELDSENVKAWIGLAVIHREFADHELSWGNLNRALEIEPGDELAAQLAVDWGIRDGRIQIAIEHVENFLSEHPHDAVSKVTLARLYLFLGKVQAAQDLAEEIELAHGSSTELMQLFAEIDDEKARVKGLANC